VVIRSIEASFALIRSIAVVHHLVWRFEQLRRYIICGDSNNCCGYIIWDEAVSSGGYVYLAVSQSIASGISSVASSVSGEVKRRSGVYIIFL
jgi:hypothetical protein